MYFNSPEELLNFAQRLEDSCIIDVRKVMIDEKGLRITDFSINPEKKYKGKGAFGDYLEEQFFCKKNDNIAEPDIQNLGIEIKASPLKDNGECLVVKERLVLGKINYSKMDKEEFETSSFVHKNKHLLIVFNIEDFSPDYGHRLIKLVDFWKTLEYDLPQIQSDWLTILEKIQTGHAHDISEGDTLYLGACTKGATTAKSMQKQPHSSIKAKGRALCFKKSYIQSIFKKLEGEKKKRDEIRLQSKEWKPIDEIVNDLVSPYLGKSGIEICNILGKPFNPKNKSMYADMARWMLGCKGRTINIEEFNAADIQVKTIRVEPNGRIKEAMSFRNIPYCDIVNEEWEDSVFYGELVSKFFLFIFKKNQDSDESYTFNRVIYWNMPEKDIEKARLVWEDTKTKITHGDYNHFVGANTEGFEVSHVRPKATTTSPYMITPQGRPEKKKCFWLNKDYIKKLLDNL